MSDTLVRVSRIQKFCTHDGPGIRTTVFLKGCPLRCAWCHNPEMRSARPVVMYAENLCVRCSMCAAACPAGSHSMDTRHAINIDACSGCGACVRACPTGALEMDSTVMTVEQVLEEVLRDRAFYGETGGITISGGEPMFQGEACLELLSKAKCSGITTALETCGYFDEKYIEALVQVTDTFLWDYKDSDPKRHKQYTAHSNERIIRNLRLLDHHAVDIRLRCIMVEGVNITDRHAEAIADMFHSLDHCTSVELLPYHAYGASKAAQIGTVPEPHREWIPSDTRMDAFRQQLISLGVKMYVC